MTEFRQIIGFVLMHRYAFYSVYYPLLVLLSFVFFLLVVMTILATVRISQSPKDIPWAGLPNSRILPKLRASMRGMMVGRKAINEGYEKFSKRDKPFILPGLHWNTVVLPPSNTSWAASQPENILSGNAVLDETMGLDYLAHGPSADSARDFSVIRRDLTRQTAKLAADVYEEIRLTIDAELGSNTNEDKEVGAMDLMRKIAFRAANRIFVGAPLCRQKSYEKRIERWSSLYGICTIVMILAIPRPLKSSFMTLVSVPVGILRWFATRELRSEIHHRLQDPAAEKKNDMMQWIISTNASKSDARELEPANIAGKMILFNLFATGTTSTMAGLVLQDILHYKVAANLLEELREEAAQYIPLIEQSNDPTALRSMAKLDSVIRESLRSNPLGAQAMVREVVAPAGVVTPDGVHLPRGTHVAVHVTAHQRDEEVFGEGAGEYRPLRHYESGENGKQRIAVQLNEEYMSFGLGRHACPWRFFAVSTMKLILGYLFMDFEVEPAAEGVEKKVWEIAESVIPSDKWKMKVRRRRKGSESNGHEEKKEAMQ
ncbi:Putative cytochrome P450 [Septoria linicola]|uniref:Cytochrome P450 n=1 Tax=Septoria linicola TaxID=215465 RepID=A0A9Q9B1M4_9PEZI|nr:Putative cytochrome P450 [Septoria linicola]